MFRKILLITFVLFVYQDIFGQSFYNRNRNRNLLVGGGTGAAFYFGDLAKPGDFSNVSLNAVITARYLIYDRYSIGTDITWFMLNGNDKKDPVKAHRNLSFTSHNFEWNLYAHVSLYPEDGRFYLRSMFNPYIYGGIGIVQYNPRAELNGEKYALRPLHTEGPDNTYSGISVSFPCGIGVKYRLNPFINICLDGGFRYTLTDYLDDVSSGYYPAPTDFDNDVARKLSDRSGELGKSPSLSESGTMVRGNPSNKDAYFMFNLKAEYYIGNLNLGFGKSYGSKMGRSKNKQPKLKKSKYKPPRMRRR